jgi:hypothetical protein
VIAFKDPEDAAEFEVGDECTIELLVPWHHRVWRWLTRYKPPRVVIIDVDHESGSITFADPSPFEQVWLEPEEAEPAWWQWRKRQEWGR